MKMTKKQQAANSARINKAYGIACHGIQISIWDMSKVMDVGLKSIADGDDDDALKKKLREFVNTIAKNNLP